MTGMNSFDFAGSAVLSDSIDRTEQLTLAEHHVKQQAGQGYGTLRVCIKYTCVTTTECNVP